VPLPPKPVVVATPKCIHVAMILPTPLSPRQLQTADSLICVTVCEEKQLSATIFGSAAMRNGKDTAL
jgi:hypothetical protein